MFKKLFASIMTRGEAQIKEELTARLKEALSKLKEQDIDHNDVKDLVQVDQDVHVAFDELKIAYGHAETAFAHAQAGFDAIKRLAIVVMLYWAVYAPKEALISMADLAEHKPDPVPPK